MPDDQFDPQGDPFRPPEQPVEVSCLHCGETYDSYLIEWRILTDADGKRHGFWCCPTPDCGGMGFGFDILPTDPDYRDERGGWVHCDDEDEEYDEECDEDGIDEDFSAEGPTGRDKPGGNGNGPAGPFSGDEQVPF